MTLWLLLIFALWPCFTRCKGGISHHPAESITIDDVAASLSVLYKTISKLKHT